MKQATSSSSAPLVVSKKNKKNKLITQAKK
jgi:hypothetical protein